MQKISQLLAPALVGVVKEKSTLGAIAEMQNSVYDGATMIDLHLPCLENTEEGELKKIIDAARVPVLALYYPTGKDVPCEEERVEALLRAVRAGAAGIDMQGYTYHLPSKNEFCGEDIYSFTKGDPKEIVTVAQNEEDLAESIRAMLLLKKEVKTPVTYHAGGKHGRLSRIINPLLGGHMAFCVDRYHANSVMEQLDLRTAATVVENMRKFK